MGERERKKTKLDSMWNWKSRRSAEKNPFVWCSCFHMQHTTTAAAARLFIFNISIDWASPVNGWMGGGGQWVTLTLHHTEKWSAYIRAMQSEWAMRCDWIKEWGELWARARARAKKNFIIASQVRNEPHTELHFAHMWYRPVPMFMCRNRTSFKILCA